RHLSLVARVRRAASPRRPPEPGRGNHPPPDARAPVTWPGDAGQARLRAAPLLLEADPGGSRVLQPRARAGPHPAGGARDREGAPRALAAAAGAGLRALAGPLSRRRFLRSRRRSLRGRVGTRVSVRVGHRRERRKRFLSITLGARSRGGTLGVRS